MKQFTTGATVGCGLMFLTLWLVGFRKHHEEVNLEKHQKRFIRSDLSWFAEIEGYPELVYKNHRLVKALSEPDRVSVYRIKESGDLKIGGHSLTTEKEVSEKDRDYFSTVVCSPTSMANISACQFEPGFAIRFHKGNTSFYALICYSCSDIIFFDTDENQVSGWGMTYEAKLALIQKFYKLFPNDPEVQSIKL